MKKKIHKELKDYKICGEWFNSSAVEKINFIIKEENKFLHCSKEDALKTKKTIIVCVSMCKYGSMERYTKL